LFFQGLRLCALAVLVAGYLRAKSILAGEHFMPPIAAIDNAAYNAPTSQAVVLSVLQIHAVLFNYM
jgi:hypothetical protein